MKLPRDLGGEKLARALARVGYRVTRQTGSHLRLTNDMLEEHHVTIPAHQSLRVGTLAAILAEIADHLEISREELLDRIFD